VCEGTNASGVRMNVFNNSCINCSAKTTNSLRGFGANSFGGSLSAVYIGAYAFSLSNFFGSISVCGVTRANRVDVRVIDSFCQNCSAVTTCSGIDGSFGVNSYGGSISAVYIGAYAFSFSTGLFEAVSTSHCNSTEVRGLMVSVSFSSFHQSKAVSRKCTINGTAFIRYSLLRAESIQTLGANVSFLYSKICQSHCTNSLLLCRCLVVQSA
jgi:hypothetical protein